MTCKTCFYGKKSVLPYTISCWRFPKEVSNADYYICGEYKNSTFENYECSHCKITGVKLWLSRVQDIPYCSECLNTLELPVGEPALLLDGKLYAVLDAPRLYDKWLGMRVNFKIKGRK